MTAPEPRPRVPLSWRILFWAGAAAVIALVVLWAVWGFRWPPTATVASAQGGATDVRESSFFDPDARQRGQVVALDRRDHSLVIRTPGGEDLRFELSPQAFVLDGERRRSFDALRLGQVVVIRAELDREPAEYVDFVSIVDTRTFAETLAEAPLLDVADTATVVAVDAAAGTFSTRDEDGGVRSFRLAENGLILSGSDRIELSELRPGDRVAVMSSAAGEGEPAAAELVQLVIDSEPG